MRALLIAASVLVLAACGYAADAQENEGADSGPSGQRSFDVGAFDSVSLGGPHNVVVQVGPAASVRAEGSAGQLDRLEIEVEGSSLKIRNKRDSWGMNVSGRPVTIYVTTPTLAGASIGGSGDMRIDKVEGDRFKASIGGSGDMEIASLRVGEADLSIAGSGGIRAIGAATRQRISIAGSGDVDAAGLESRSADVSIVGSGDVRARATETADVSIMGSGDVELSGGARCSIRKMGSGEVRCV